MEEENKKDLTVAIVLLLMAVFCLSIGVTALGGWLIVITVILALHGAFKPE